MEDDYLDYFEEDFVIGETGKKEKVHNKNVAKKSEMESNKKKNVAKSKIAEKLGVKEKDQQIESELSSAVSQIKLEKIADRDPFKMLMEVFLDYESFMESHKTEAPENLLKLLHIDSEIIQLPFILHVQKLVQDLCAYQKFWLEILRFIKQLISSPGSSKVTPNLNVELFWQDLEVVINYILVNYQQDEWEIVREFFDNLSALPVTPQIEKILKIKTVVEQNKAVDNIYEVYPSINDLKSDNSKLIKNKVIGKYENVNEYLKVHLPLLKQDFLSPLKAAIKEYFDSPDRSGGIYSKECVFVYPKAKIVIKQKLFDEKFVAIKFKGNFENIASTQFMNDQLLCLTKTHSIDALVLAVVKYRDPKLIKEGFVEVDIVQMENVQDLMNEEFVMFEYFQSHFDIHYHTFNTIKNLTDLNFPFEQYFLKLKKTDEYPDYLKADSEPQYELKQCKFDVKDPTIWPLPQQLHLQKQEYLALQSALTKKLTLIQKLPNYFVPSISLEIIEALLNNTESQIVIITYKNSVLDRLILECSKFCDRKEIIRLGAQSKNEKIKMFFQKDSTYRSEFSARYHGKLRNEQKQAITLMQRSMGFEKLRIARSLFNNYNMMIEENKQMSMYNVIKKKRIIGMTASYAARCSSIIKMMNAPIVILEEAEKIPESKLISCLSSYVQQIILIGDHQEQSQIYKNNFTTYNSEMSLFVRLVKNDMPVITMEEPMSNRPAAVKKDYKGKVVKDKVVVKQEYYKDSVLKIKTSKKDRKKN